MSNAIGSEDSDSRIKSPGFGRGEILRRSGCPTHASLIDEASGSLEPRKRTSNVVCFHCEKHCVEGIRRFYISFLESQESV